MIRRYLSLFWIILWLVGSCYDTPLIPDDALRGDAGQSTRSEGGAEDGEGGASADTRAGRPHGGSPSAGNPSAGSPSAGSASKPSGGAGTGGAVNTGGTIETGEAGQAGEPTASRISWLELSADQAPPASEPNRSLGIQGTFHYYSDGCADVLWNSETRCVSGKLCDPRLEPGAWGVAIGFDFRDSGELGTPPNTKRTWNPTEVGALGVAWQVSGEAPAFEVWVLNMASEFGDACGVMSCEIDGPPDGVDMVPLDGELLFNHMHKDDWGGSGLDYDFDPARVHALQLKLPAIKVPNATFDFCIDALGIVVAP